MLYPAYSLCHNTLHACNVYLLCLHLALHRYRVLFNTLLAGSPDVEEGLVQADSPFAGSKRFGMCYLDERGRLAAVGTTLEIQDFALEPGGRM